ncbi:hypothetical protein VWZ88_09275 [Phaeobacter sp. JH20_36]
MAWLTEEQERQLQEARKQVEAAQKTIADFEKFRRPLRVSRRKLARQKAMQTSSAACPSENKKSTSTTRSTGSEIIRPQPKSRLRGAEPPLPELNQIKRLFEDLRSLDRVAQALGRGRRDAVKALATAGIDIREEIAREWDAGRSIRELHEQHGSGCDTISRWIKQAGRKVRPRNSNKKCDEELIVCTYLKTRSAKRCADAAGVSWEKARSVLRKRGLWEK